jgi:galactonate dehydratase
MKITHLETFMANAGLRNYLFIRLHTDEGLTGVGEATLEWQEKTVETLLDEWVEGRVLGKDPFDVERVVGDMIRDQYSGGSTVMTAISGVEIAMWDIIGKACGQPIYKLLGGRCHDSLPSYANGWYGGAVSPAEYAEMAKDAVAKGYRALKFDPFGTAWKSIDREESERAVDFVAAVREAVGPDIELMIEYHGRLSVDSAIRMIERLECFRPAWSEEPVTPDSIELLAEVKRRTSTRIAAGERLYTLSDFQRITSQRAVDVLQMDIAHCGGIWVSKKIAAMAQAQDIVVAPHVSVGPVALAAALHFDISTPNFYIQEAFGEFDVPWRNDLVGGWNPVVEGEFVVPEGPGLGIDIDEDEISRHPYVQHAFPSLWDKDWITDFKQDEKTT